MSFQNKFTVLISPLKSSFNTVADSFPVRRTCNYKSHLGFEIWLVKRWKYFITMESFKLSVQILILIRSVSICVKTNSVFIVSIEIFQLHCIPAKLNYRTFKFDSLFYKYIFTLQQIIINTDICNCYRFKVQKQLALVWSMM